MVEMDVRQEDITDRRQCVERQVADAAAGVDQDVVVEPQRGSALGAATDSAITAEHLQLHGFSPFLPVDRQRLPFRHGFSP